jgi:hypothetical protein
MAKLNLPSKLTKDSWFYEKHKDVLEKHLDKQYISYSTQSSWVDYREDFIKQKLANIKLPDSIYSAFGSWVGESTEHGVAQVNDYDFKGAENLELIPRPEGAIYERLIVIDFGEWILIGFIDVFVEKEGKVASLVDIKSGGAKKEEGYKKEEYTQVILYAKALEDEGYTIDKTGVWFVRRTGSHIKPPLTLSTEQFYIPLEYNQERVDYAINKLKKAVEEISEINTTFQKIFK